MQNIHSKNLYNWSVEKEKYKDFEHYVIPEKAYRDGSSGIYVPIKDFLRINGTKVEIEEDDEELKQHLARVKAKNLS